MNKKFFVIILLVALQLNATEPATINSLINTTFEICSLADIYTTVTHTQQRLNKLTPSSRTEQRLIAQQSNTLRQLSTALEPYALEPGFSHKQLQESLLHALQQERRECMRTKQPHIDTVPWQQVINNINGLNQALSSSAAWTDDTSATNRILAGAAGTAVVGYGLYKLFTSSAGKSIGRMLIKPVQKVWQSTVKAINVVKSGGLKKLSTLKTLAIDFLLQFIIMKGLGEAETLMAEDDRKAQQPVKDQLTELQKQLEKKQKELETTRNANLTKISEEYKKSFTALNASTVALVESTHDEYYYILQLINIAQATTQYQLFNPITMDLLFAQSAMLTPKKANGTVWHNIWNDPNAYGNWLFDPNLNAFVQCGAPLGALKKNITNFLQRQAANKNEFDPYSADYNQIFTEYFPTDESYEITIEITLIDAAFPFCCGIAFNKARWLAGSLDRDAAYRFIGIVGTLNKDGQKTLQLNAPNKAMGIYAAQATMDTFTGHITSPILQIFDSKSTLQPLVNLTSDLPDIGINPLTYTIHIVNHPDYVDVTIKHKDQTSQTKTISFKNDITMSKTLYWYHGIGFIAPRCQAAFSIKAPTELRYQDTEINAFRKG